MLFSSGDTNQCAQPLNPDSSVNLKTSAERGVSVEVRRHALRDFKWQIPN
jgi:hypothetical protein